MSRSVVRDEDEQKPGPLREAVFHLDWRDIEMIGFGDLFTHCQDVGIHSIRMLEGDCCQSVCELEVAAQLDGQRLAELACVEQWELVTETEGGFLYLLKLSASMLPEAITESHEELIGTCEPTVGENGISMSLLGPQEAIQGVFHIFEEVDVRPDLRKLGAYRGEKSAVEKVTDRQLEVIRTAYELGYYEVPRRATMKDIAAEIGVEPATVSEHVQRAERNIIRKELSLD